MHTRDSVVNMGKGSRSKKRWFEQHRRTLGWLGLVIVLLSFISKGQIEKSLEAKKKALDDAGMLLEADNATWIERSSLRKYGVEKADLMEAYVIRLEDTLKLSSNDGYFYDRIKRLATIQRTARTDFLKIKRGQVCS